MIDDNHCDTSLLVDGGDTDIDDDDDDGDGDDDDDIVDD